MGLFTFPTSLGGMESALCLCRRRHRVPVILLFRHHGPEATRHFVGKCNRHNHVRLSSPQARQPAIVPFSKPLERPQSDHRARDQANVTLPHF